MVFLHVDVTGYRLDELAVRGQRSVLKSTMGKMASRWSSKYLALHFKSGNDRRYGYKRRSAATRKRKRQLAARGVVVAGGLVPLLHSGDLQRQVMASRFAVKEFPTRATIKLQGPNYLRIRPRSGRPNLAEEITTVIPSERRDLASFADKTLTKQIENWIKINGTRRLNKVRKRKRKR